MVKPRASNMKVLPEISAKIVNYDACLLTTTYNDSLEQITRYCAYHENICSSSSYRIEHLIVFENNEIEKANTIKGLFRASDKCQGIHILINTKTSGFPACLNYGISYAHCDIIIRIDIDDKCEPSRLDMQIQALIDRNVDLCYSNMRTNTGKLLRYPTSKFGIWRDMCLGLNPIPHPAICFKKHIVQSVGGYNEKLTKAEDLDLWIRLLLETDIQLFCINEPLVEYNTLGAEQKDRANAIAQIKVRISHCTHPRIETLAILCGILCNLIRLILPRQQALRIRRFFQSQYI
jgi:hypothetical protein